MFDFNAGEIILLVVFAVVIFGPEKLPDLARKAARVIHYLRNIANDAQGRLREELGPEYADLNLTDLNPKALVNKHLLQPVQDGVAPVAGELAPVKAELTPSKVDRTPPRAKLQVESAPAIVAPGTGGARADAELVPVAFDSEAT